MVGAHAAVAQGDADLVLRHLTGYGAADQDAVTAETMRVPIASASAVSKGGKLLVTISGAKLPDVSAFEVGPLVCRGALPRACEGVAVGEWRWHTSRGEAEAQVTTRMPSLVQERHRCASSHATVAHLRTTCGKHHRGIRIMAYHSFVSQLRTSKRHLLFLV